MNILIVESKAKCKTILKHLGRDDWRVLSTGGHVETLPSDREKHPKKEVKKAYWSSRGDQLPEPPWVWEERGEAAMKAIKKEAEQHDDVTFYLASDPDREGERIAWHLEKLLTDLGPCRRVTFQEVTKTALLKAVSAPKDVDQALVDAALIRLFVDRLVGWRTGKVARRFSNGKGAMGRVQTPTLGFVVERELERDLHVPVAYFEVRARTGLTQWKVHFHEKKDVKAWRDDKGKFDSKRTSDQVLAHNAWEQIGASGSLTVTDVKRRESSKAPQPPFRTDTLIQAAGSRFGWRPSKTAKLAGQLYSTGFVTYIRTDSTRMSEEAVLAGKAFVEQNWGRPMVADQPAVDPKEEGIQDAHEAIRPTNLSLLTVPEVDADTQKLYALIRCRTLAALMIPAKKVSLSLTATVADLALPIKGSVNWYSEPGWCRAFDLLDEAVDTRIKTVKVGQVDPLMAPEPDISNPEFVEDATKPPGRYRAPAIIRMMKTAGIGRPSTFAKTVEKLVSSRYLIEEDGSLAPTEAGRSVWLGAAPLYTLTDGEPIFASGYTAEMERQLDAVADGHSAAGAVWVAMRDAIRDAHERAKIARDQGQLTAPTLQRLRAYIGVDGTVAEEIGDLTELTEAQGKEWEKTLRERGLVLPPTEKQLAEVERLLAATGLTLEKAAEESDLILSEPLSRKESSALIEWLKAQVVLHRVPSPKQLRWIADLAKKKGLDESAACALVDCENYAALGGGRGGSASALIEALKGEELA
jgi:DNA topoisomerase-1